MKLAVVITGANYRYNVGINKIALTRAILLQQRYGYKIDYYYLECEYVKFELLKFLKGDISISQIIHDGKEINILHKYEFDATNRLNRRFLRHYYNKTKRRIADWEWQRDLGKYVKGYDLITAHYNDAAIIAYGAYLKYGTPYCVTWHGSDIHTIPFNDDAAKEKTILIMNNASCNFFVSNALVQISDALTTDARKEVIYNSVDDCFLKFSNEKRIHLRKQYGVDDKKVVAYVGHLIDIKNAVLLPDIFKQISQLYSKDIEFWIVGQGVLEKIIRSRLGEYNLNFKMHGFVEPKNMPDLLNCTDVLVLPSQNEGLPLVTIEALRCGANVVGSSVGGISEVIGTDNVVDIDELFVENFAKKVVSIMKTPINQPISDKFDWTKIVEFEHRVYSSIV